MIYCVATIQEVQRLSCVAPATLLHTTTKDVEVKGYKIKKGTRMIANLTKFMMDPIIFPEPECLIPERFIQEEENDFEKEIKLKVRLFRGVKQKLNHYISTFEHHLLKDTIYIIENPSVCAFWNGKTSVCW